MITEVFDPKLSAEKALTDTLTGNLRDMYQKGFIDGQVQIVATIASNLEKVAQAAQCPDDLKPGFTEAVKYLKSITSGQPYQLTGKDLGKAVETDKKTAKAEMVAKATASAQQTKKKLASVNPEARA